MSVNVITQEDFDLFKKEFMEEFKNKVVEELKNFLNEKQTRLLQETKKQKFLKSYQVEKMLGISAGTLQNLRINGTIPFSKVGGTILFEENEILQLIKDNKFNTETVNETIFK